MSQNVPFSSKLTVEVDEQDITSVDDRSSRSSRSSFVDGYRFLLDQMTFNAAAIVSWRNHGLNAMGRVGVVFMRNFTCMGSTVV